MQKDNKMITNQKDPKSTNLSNQCRANNSIDILNSLHKKTCKELNEKTQIQAPTTSQSKLLTIDYLRNTFAEVVRSSISQLKCLVNTFGKKRLGKRSASSKLIEYIEKNI